MKDRYLVLIIGILIFISVQVALLPGSCPICPDGPLPDSSDENGISGVINLSPPTTAPLPNLHEAIVVKVVDGDTVDLQDGQRVRLLGINTPEKGQPYYSEAAERLSELVLEQKVWLEMDRSDKGKYGRLLRHVYADVGDGSDGIRENVAVMLLREGLANVYFVSPDLKYKEEFEGAESYAKVNGLGIWSASDYRECIGVSYFRYNAEGDDRYNLNGEYVKFRNSCGFAISMKGWTVKDEATHIYEFPAYVLASHQTMTLFTGSGADSADNLYWGSGGAIWNNDGDTLYLWDADGGLVLEYGY